MEVTMELFVKNLLVGISIGSIYSLIGLGIVIIYKSSRIFNFAAGGVVALGAFIFLGFAVNLHISISLAMILTVIVGLSLGLTTERIFLRPMIGQPILAVIMMTLALGSIYEGIVFLVGGGKFKTFVPIIKSDTITIGKIALPSIYVFTILAVIALFILLSLFFKYTKLGLGMRAAAEDHQVAQSKGVRVTLLFGVSWGICFLVFCLCGIFLGSITGSASHKLVFIALKAFPVVLCGGLESFLGCLIMGPVMGVTEIFSVAYLGHIIPWTGFDDISPYLLMLLIMLFRPEGLFGLKKIERI
ncbi:MAG: branched-chain amino acid ABC transporter permease [Thermodesulfobacteriota bacterium]|nr:branched-chain amino acid ABC transporter permease [Thermodesulfobacteriota bacterium]